MKKVKKKNNKKLKAFTLVELLAVIVILGVLLVIAVPNVIGAINTSKKKALVNIANNIIQETQKKYANDIDQYGKYFANYSGDIEITYDINKDLGFAKDESVKGISTFVLWEENTVDPDGDVPLGGQPYSYILFLYTDDYIILKWIEGAPYKATDSEVTVNDVMARDDQNSSLINAFNKETYGILNSSRELKCMPIDMDTFDGSYVDGQTLRHLGHYEGVPNAYAPGVQGVECGTIPPDQILYRIQELIPERR